MVVREKGRGRTWENSKSNAGQKTVECGPEFFGLVRRLGNGVAEICAFGGCDDFSHVARLSFEVEKRFRCSAATMDSFKVGTF